MEDKIKDVQQKAKSANVSERPVGSFMTKGVIALRVGDSIRHAISVFKTHKVSGAPVLGTDNALKGILSEYDLVLQAAIKDLDTPFEFTSKVTAVRVDAKLKDIIVIFYKQKIKRIPVIGAANTVVGIVSRIDLLNTLAFPLEDSKAE
ncbi:MAG: hypothetical protein A2504_17260 [Bdellovibrionales bacterium RIFOXYD12_FULL_39_22]|nr:MAG: hypothetical protein A2385_10700 [Bdellovibrionales bacterium RIFOXYB1_FULL_39_21]OFZ40755.1 MAG: hypothetical protein A2485_17030 [Bdellovibrionales bacterium RIFOXYC12_FULL_39_17]OFZ48177.1 MAG: hypothetical protein A2404_17190 [Bdellovibrionales bacterium RIFOXYC1_FULL_39_130]OFZ73354.1 MAG: hypothetical protein A2451_04425 [Bdellovibrionales bacterium RIFOXYC2_FULL_39_8]OFZ75827.1 MAG: hypothetical protein A2560_13690 [Bdellovibrionales bacterium RIFOXYD1_FULL_39_84]OFZ91888.1 MAG: